MIREHRRQSNGEGERERVRKKKKVNTYYSGRQSDVAVVATSTRKTTRWYFFFSLVLSSSGVCSTPNVVCFGGYMLARLYICSFGCLQACTTITNGVFFFSLPLLLRSTFVPFYFNPFRSVVIEHSRMQD